MDSPCIYIMYWDIECPYIGQTVSLKKRINSHFNALNNRTHVNYKIQELYDKLKVLPKVEVLQYCDYDDLNYLEELYIKDFDSIDHGLNIISGGYSVGRGVHNPASIYTEEQLVQVLELLSDVNNSYRCITQKTGVPRDTITKIVSGIHHTWLEEKYPELYSRMRSISSKDRYKMSACAKAQGKSYYKIMDPAGKIYEVTNTLEFSKTHNLPNGNLCLVISGKRNSVKGWKVVKE